MTSQTEQKRVASSNRFMQLTQHLSLTMKPYVDLVDSDVEIAAIQIITFAAYAIEAERAGTQLMEEALKTASSKVGIPVAALRVHADWMMAFIELSKCHQGASKITEQEE